jgi:glycosyltransferase involved in cell wall biosynthesis
MVLNLDNKYNMKLVKIRGEKMSGQLISIITVCYNSEEYIQDTIESVLNQTYNNIEYIIVDGNSTDNTLDIIKQYEPKFKGKMKWISEKDAGIYDAMNKGINMATGEWIHFMNSGDNFYSKEVLSDIFNNYELIKDYDVLYGQFNALYDSRNSKIVSPGKLDELWKGMVFCHQTAFIKLDLIKNNLYNLEYKICADFDFFYKMYLEDKKFRELDVVIANYDVNGVSNNRIELFKEKAKVVLSKKDKFNYKTYFFFGKFKILIKERIKKVLPNNLVRKIQMITKNN